MAPCLPLYELLLLISVANCFVSGPTSISENICFRGCRKGDRVFVVRDATEGIHRSTWRSRKMPLKIPNVQDRYVCDSFIPLYVANGRQRLDEKVTEEENQSKKSVNTTEEANKDNQTLYELLQVPSNATREQIKQSYIKMAKITHPDALGSMKADGDKFSEIASAYKLLSDPKERKRYDRSLVAENFKREVEKAASELGKSAGPQFFALLRRTGVTTKAVIESALKELQQRPNNVTQTVTKASEVNSTKNPPQFAKVLNSALKAGQDASRVIDKLEMAEKGRSLELRARKELAQANLLRKKASEVAEQRLLVALYTPKSGLTSSDARALLDRLNSTDLSFSFLDSMLAKRSLDVHVQRLEHMEKDYQESIALLNSIESEYRASREAFERSVMNLNSALEAEKKAREALEKALREVSQSKLQVAESKRNSTNAEFNRRWINQAAEKTALGLMQYQERVRIELLAKCEVDSKFQEEFANVDFSSSLNSNEAVAIFSLESLAELKEQENMLISESLRLEDLAARLASRAEKLKTRAGNPFGDISNEES